MARTCCDNFLYGFKGAPRRAGPDGLDMEHENGARSIAGEMSGQGGPPWAAGVRAGRRTVGGAAAFVAPFGRKPYGAPSCRARWPRVTGRVRFPP
jgi:hypothetical protein